MVLFLWTNSKQINYAKVKGLGAGNGELKAMCVFFLFFFFAGKVLVSRRLVLLVVEDCKGFVSTTKYF